MYGNKGSEFIYADLKKYNKPDGVNFILVDTMLTACLLPDAAW